MFITKKALPRRTFLRAMGTTVALPFLDAMVPALSAQAKPTPRFGFVYIANGVIQNQWKPATTGAGFELTPILQPFANVRDRINVLSGLSHLQADTFGDGTGDHPRASAVWLTGVHAYDRDAAGRRGQAGDHRRPDDRAADRRHVPHPVARAGGRLPDAGLVRFRRLLLRQHRLVAERDDAEPDRVASAHRLRAAVRRRRQRRRAAGAQPERGQHPRLGARGGEPASPAASGAGDKAKLGEYLDSVREVEQRIQNAEAQPVEIELPERPTDIPTASTSTPS